MPKAVVVHEYGGPEVLKWEEVPVGEPAPQQIRIKQEVAGLNYVDTYYRSGLYKLDALPGVLGMEGAGVVDAVGSEVKDFRPGDRIAYASGPVGSYAEMRLMPSYRVVKIPDWCSSRLAASIMLQGMTVHYLIHDCFSVGKGTIVLLHAAAGGVGQILVQWAKAKGATVIGTVGSEEKAAKIKSLGADHAILYTKDDFVGRVKDITGGKKADVVYDSVGKTTFMGSLDCLQPRGMMVSFGQASGPVEPVNPVVFAEKGSLFFTRPSLRDYTMEPSEMRRRAEDLFAVVQNGTVKIEEGASFPLKDAAEAHRALESRKTTGSIVLLV